MGVAYYSMLLICSTAYQLETSPPQWPIILVAGIAGMHVNPFLPFLSARSFKWELLSLTH